MADKITRYGKYNLKQGDELLPSYIIGDVVEGNGRDVAESIKITMCGRSKLSLLINNRDNYEINDIDKEVIFTRERFGNISSIKVKEVFYENICVMVEVTSSLTLM